MRTGAILGLLFLLFLLFFLSCLPMLCHAKVPGQVASGLISVKDARLELIVNECQLTLFPRSKLLLYSLDSASTISSLRLLEGKLKVRSLAPRAPTLLWQGTLGIRPGPRGALLSCYSNLSSLLPERPVELFIGGSGNSVIGPKGMPERPLPAKSSFLLAYDRLLSLPPSFSSKERVSSDKDMAEVKIVLAPSLEGEHRIRAHGMEFALKQEDSFKSKIRSNDVYERNSLHMLPRELFISLDRNCYSERSVSLGFEESRKKGRFKLSNNCKTGSNGALRFLTLEGYIVILAPESRVKVEIEGNSQELATALRLKEGAAMVLPPSTESPSPEGIVPLHFEGSAPFKLKYGSALFLADSSQRISLAPVLASMHQRFRHEREIFQRIGRRQAAWGRFAETRAMAATPNTSATTTPMDLLQPLARAKSYNTPLFTPLERLPCRVSSFLENAAIHVDGSSALNHAYVVALGDRHPDWKGRDDLSSFKASRLGNYLKIYEKDEKDEAVVLHFFRSCLPGAKEDEKLTGRRCMSTYIFRDRTVKISDKRKVLRPEEVGSVKKARDWVNLQLQERPYRAACVGTLLLALLMYVIAKGPKQVLLALWRLLTFFRGEPCHKCGMPLEKFALPPLPIDERLAISSRLIFFGGAMSPSEFVEGIPQAMKMQEEIGEEELRESRFFVDGDCIWCLRCRKGQLRFRLLEDGQLREESKHPVLLPHFIETLRRWNDSRAKS